MTPKEILCIYCISWSGKLYNVGFSVVRDMRPDINCFVFHDVDLIPEDSRMLYSCVDDGPVHLGAFVDTLGYE